MAYVFDIKINIILSWFAQIIDYHADYPKYTNIIIRISNYNISFFFLKYIYKMNI